MKTFNIIQFEDHEREAILRALEGLELLVEAERRGEPYHPIQSFIHRVQGEESFDARALEELVSALTACIQKLAPETEVSWWRERAGAQTEALSPDGLAGLAEALYSRSFVNAVKASERFPLYRLAQNDATA